MSDDKNEQKIGHNLYDDEPKGSSNEPQVEQKQDNDKSTISTDELKVEQKSDDNESKSSSSEPQAKQKQDNAQPTISTDEPKVDQKSDDGISTTSIAYQEKSSKIDQKGFGDSKYSSERKFRNPFGDEESRQKDESKYSSQSSTKEKSKYADLQTQLLETWQERYTTEIRSLKKQYDDLTEKIEDLSEEKREAYSLSEERRIQKKLDRFRQEREEKRLKLEQLEKDLDELDKELSERESNEGRYGRRWNGANQGDSSEEYEDVTPKSLFEDDKPIQNTVLYVATFFPGLNPQDFKRVVSLLLEGRTKTLIVKESITTEEGKTQIKETQKEKLLIEIWQESFEKPDKYLRICYLKVIRQNNNQGIYFNIPHLRQDFLTYFEKEESLYLEEQLRRTQKLDLLLDMSNNIAEKAINIAVKAAIDYPNYYAEDWLIELLVKIAKEEEQRINPLLVRLSNLIYQLQIESNYPKSEDIAQSFLEHLMSPEYRSLAFLIVQDLMDKHLRSGALGIQPAKHLLNWLRKLLDQEGLEKKDGKLQADIYSLLEELLWQSGFYSYIYDFLGILKEWLPAQDLTPEEYSLSNKAILFVVFNYCGKTIYTLPLKWYGKWPSVYPLFAPFYNKSEIFTELDNELRLLFSWLFYVNSNGTIAVVHALNDFNLEYINPLEEIAFFIAEWLVILVGFEDAEPEASALVDNLIRHIILNTSHYQQNQLKEFWTSLISEYLDKATKYNELGDRQLKKQFATRRKVLRKANKQFKALKKK